MVGIKSPSISIDLDHFKLHLRLSQEAEFTLHFNSPSRRFYLSVIVLVIQEMNKRGKIVSISLDEHLQILTLLNETIGGSAGSSHREQLLSRIYRKWKDALPDLEKAPLFKVVGRKKENRGFMGTGYDFSEKEKDCWANLFEYKGSHENVRLRFSIDRLGMDLEDVTITYESSTKEGEAGDWEHFIAGLRENSWSSPEPSGTATRKVSTDQNFQAVKTDGRSIVIRGLLVLIPALLAIGLTLFIGTVWKTDSTKSDIERTAEIAETDLLRLPSIAIMPFTAISDNENEKLLADGILTSVTTALSKTPKLFTIDYSSTMQFRAGQTSDREIAKELGVRYLLQGNLQKFGNQIRVNVRLTDFVTGAILWAEKYDRSIMDLFRMQDDITINVLRALQVELYEGEYANVIARGTDNLEAYLKTIQGYQHWQNGNRDEDLMARRLAEEAIRLDPEYAAAFSLLSMVLARSYTRRYAEDPEKERKAALKTALKAVELDYSADTLSYLATLYILMKRYDEGVQTAEKALALHPRTSRALSFIGLVFDWTGRCEDAIGLFDKALKVSPLPSANVLFTAAHAYRNCRNYDECIRLGNKAIKLSPDSIFAHRVLASCYALTGRQDQVKISAREILRIDPGFIVPDPSSIKMDDQAAIEKIRSSLIMAGIPTE